MNEMMAKWEEDKRRMDEQLEEERRRTNERIAAQSQMIANMQKMIENLAIANVALVGNTSVTQDTKSPNVVRVGSSVASQPAQLPTRLTN